MGVKSEACNRLFLTEKSTICFQMNATSNSIKVKVKYRTRTCCGDQSMFPISLIFSSIVSPSRISVSIFRGTNGNRHFTSWVMFCRFLRRTCWCTTEMSGRSLTSGGLMKSDTTFFHLLSSQCLDCNPKGKALFYKMRMIWRLKKKESYIWCVGRRRHHLLCCIE